LGLVYRTALAIFDCLGHVLKMFGFSVYELP